MGEIYWLHTFTCLCTMGFKNNILWRLSSFIYITENKTYWWKNRKKRTKTPQKNTSII